MQINLQFDSIEEMIEFSLDVAQKTGNATDVNDDDSGASKHIINVTQSEPKVNDETEKLSDVETVEKILHHFGLKLEKGKSGSSTNVVGCFACTMRAYKKLGAEKFEYEFSILSSIWGKYGGKRFDRRIVQDLAGFIDCYYGKYPLVDTERLKKQLTTCGRGSKTTDPYTPDMFLSVIEAAWVPGEATLTRYNYGYEDGQRLSSNPLMAKS